MGLKESLTVDWKYKTIEYQGDRLWIAEQFEYKGTEYLYAAVENTLEDDIIDVVFLYRVSGDKFGNVSDDKLHNELLGYVATKMIRNITKEYLESRRNKNQ